MGKIREMLKDVDLDKLSASDDYFDRCERIYTEYLEQYGKSDNPMFISAPGRVEIGGNHTDHQNGCVVAASINLDALGVVAKNGRDKIRLYSEGYTSCEVSLDDLSVVEEEKDTMAALIRGVADGFVMRGHKVGGFDAYLVSEVLNGSGLSSSAAFEVWVGTAINHLFNNGKVSAIEVAQIAQYAENVHFGKPCGLEDQMASSVGGVVFIDFKNNENPLVEKIETKIPGFVLCVIDSGADHADLTPAYAAIRSEMSLVAGFFGERLLRDVDRERFMQEIPQIRKALGDRPVLRAIHFFADNERAKQERDALKSDEIGRFIELVNESGRSSFMYLQNVIVEGDVKNQELAVCLALCDKILAGKGAFRIQGGGFAGTIEVFVPFNMVETFKKQIEDVFGKGSCHILSIRSLGATKL